MAKVTLQSIADRVGVSRMTVSNAFSRPDQLSAELRQRILEVAREAGYAGPDPAARALARGRTGSVGLLLTDRLSGAFEDAVATDFLAGVADALAGHGFALTLLAPAGPDGGAGEGFVPARDVAMDGALVYVCEPDSTDADWLVRRGLPLVSIDREPGGEVPSVNVDDRDGARQAAQHLLDLGHTRTAVLTLAAPDDPTTASHAFNASERMAGWRSALDAAGVEPVVEICAFRPSGAAREAALRLLSREDRPTAVLCYSDAFALGVLQAADELGLDVPGDVSVVGFDDGPLAATARPALTTVGQPLAAKSAAAVQLLVDVLRGPGGAEGRQVLLPTHLVVRATTGRP